MTAENFDAVIIARHIANLRRIGPLHMRRDHLDKVERAWTGRHLPTSFAHRSLPIEGAQEAVSEVPVRAAKGGQEPGRHRRRIAPHPSATVQPLHTVGDGVPDLLVGYPDGDDPAFEVKDGTNRHQLADSPTIRSHGTAHGKAARLLSCVMSILH